MLTCRIRQTGRGAASHSPGCCETGWTPSHCKELFEWLYYSDLCKQYMHEKWAHFTNLYCEHTYEQRKYIVKDWSRRVRRQKMSTNLLSKLSWAPRKSVRCVYVQALWVCITEFFVGAGEIGRVGSELVSFGTHKSSNYKWGDIFCRRLPLFPSLIIYFLCLLV